MVQISGFNIKQYCENKLYVSNSVYNHDVPITTPVCIRRVQSILYQHPRFVAPIIRHDIIWLVVIVAQVCGSVELVKLFEFWNCMEITARSRYLVYVESEPDCY